MEYRITKEELGNDWLCRTLVALDKCLEKYGQPLYVVGATARDTALKLLGAEKAKRGTKDLDVAIAIDKWDTYNDIAKTLLENNFTKDPQRKQKFYYLGENGDMDYDVDIVPFGGVEEDEIVSWPPDGNPAMSVTCFQDIMSVADTVTVEGSVSFKMAPLFGQFLLKLDAWNDRHIGDNRDAEDLFLIADNYFMTMISLVGENVPEAIEPYDDDTDPIVYGARWLAYDVSKVLTDNHLHYYVNLISEELKKEESSDLITQLMSFRSSSDSYQLLCDMWSNYMSVLNNEIEERKKS